MGINFDLEKIKTECHQFSRHIGSIIYIIKVSRAHFLASCGPDSSATVGGAKASQNHVLVLTGGYSWLANLNGST